MDFIFCLGLRSATHRYNRPNSVFWWNTLPKLNDQVSWKCWSIFEFIHFNYLDVGPAKIKRGLLQPGQERSMPALSLKLLLPPTDYYITYEGSATTPACQETSTWILFNRPLYITEQQVCLHRFDLIDQFFSESFNQHFVYTMKTVVCLEGLETRQSQSESNQVFDVNIVVSDCRSDGQQLSPHPTHSSSTRSHQYWLHIIRGNVWTVADGVPLFIV